MSKFVKTPKKTEIKSFTQFFAKNCGFQRQSLGRFPQKTKSYAVKKVFLKRSGEPFRRRVRPVTQLQPKKKEIFLDVAEMEGLRRRSARRANRDWVNFAR